MTPYETLSQKIDAGIAALATPRKLFINRADRDRLVADAPSSDWDRAGIDPKFRGLGIVDQPEGDVRVG